MNIVAIDTNILVYLLLPQESEEDEVKQKLAWQVMEDLKKGNSLVIPLQAYKEFINVAERKFSLTFEELKELIKVLSSLIPNVVSETAKTVELTLDLRKRYKLGYWDSIIIANCLENNVSVLLTEDKTYEYIELGRKKLYMLNPFEE
jgi:predicted nucleic acid-binding protein